MNLFLGLKNFWSPRYITLVHKLIIFKYTEQHMYKQHSYGAG